MTMTDEANPYRRGTGHVLIPGHDPASCTACAYEQGRRDEANTPEYDPLTERLRKALQVVVNYDNKRRRLNRQCAMPRWMREHVDSALQQEAP